MTTLLALCLIATAAPETKLPQPGQILLIQEAEERAKRVWDRIEFEMHHANVQLNENPNPGTGKGGSRSRKAKSDRRSRRERSRSSRPLTDLH